MRYSMVRSLVGFACAAATLALWLIVGCLGALAQVPQLMPFSADMQLTFPQNEYGPRELTGRLFVDSGHMRINTYPSRGEIATIVHFATKTYDTLDIDLQLYSESNKVGHGALLSRNITRDLKPYGPDPCVDEPDRICKMIGVEQVRGRICDHWELTDTHSNVANVWIDQNLHFPIKAIWPDSTILLTNIEEWRPNPNLFRIPSGYHNMNSGRTGGQPPQQ